MTARSNALQVWAYAAESAWAEAVDTTTTRLQVLGRPEFSPSWPMLQLNPVVGRQDEGVWGRRGVKGGTISFELELGGHGGTAAGALTNTDLAVLLGYFFGGNSASSVGGSLTGASHTVTHLDTAACAFGVGEILRVGAHGDGRADGQPSVVSAFADNGADEDVDLSVALPAAPNDSDTVKGMIMVYPRHDGAVTSLRFLVRTANLQYWLRGCYPQSAAFSGLQPGGQPRVRLTFGVSRWDMADETFPGSSSSNAKPSAPSAGGSFFYQDAGTSTRATRNIRDLEFRVDVGVQPLMGTGGAEYQPIIGAVRTTCMGHLRAVVDSEAATTSPTEAAIFERDENSATRRQALYMANHQDGRALALYMPNCVPEGENPVQRAGDGDLNVVEFSLRGLTTTDATNDLTLSNWRLGLG